MSKFFFIFSLFVLLLSACRSSRQVVQHETHDSTSVSFAEVEKIVHIDGDSVTVTMQAAFDTPGGYSGTGALINGTLPERVAVEGSFIPQAQTIETKRTSVRLEFTKTGEIKATAISKDLDEKVTVQEKTITKSKSEMTVTQVKDSWFKRTIDSARRSFNTILIILALLAVVSTAIKLGFNPNSIIKNLFKKS